jgi:hypothetical protein
MIAITSGVSAKDATSGQSVILDYSSSGVIGCDPIYRPSGYPTMTPAPNTSGNYGLTAGNSGTFTLICSTGSTYLSASDYLNVTSAPSGTISASPNPCTIPTSTAHCSSTISWNTSNTPSATVIVTGGSTFGYGISGSQSAPWIDVSGTQTFYLQSSTGSTLALVTVSGVCASGSSWNGSVCAAAATPYLNLYFSPYP